LKKKLVIGGVLGALVGLLIITGAAIAQTPTPGDGNGGGLFGGPGGRGGPGGDGPHHDPAVFAKALGLTEEELQAELDAGKTYRELVEEYGLDESVLQADREARIQEKVDAGELTQEEADAILSGERPLGPGFGGPGGHGGRGGPGGFHHDPAVFAEALGLTEEELQAELDAGKTPRDLIEEYGLDEEVLRAAFEAEIQAKVEAGELTQEQADAILSGEMPEGFGPGFGGGKGGPGGHGEFYHDPAVFAEALGLTEEELQAELDAGKTPRDLIEEYGLDQEVLRAAFEAEIQAKVDAGELTQEQADAILSGEMPFGFGGPKGPRNGQGDGTNAPTDSGVSSDL